MSGTTQNVSVERYTFNALAIGNYYYPSATGTNCDGFDHVTFRASLTSTNINTTVTMTIESDDGVTGTFAWDESLGLWNWMTGAYGTASWVATNTTTYARLLAFNHNARLWRVKIAITNGAANSGIINIRKIKV